MERIIGDRRLRAVYRENKKRMDGDSRARETSLRRTMVSEGGR
jgi:hypothetical protein